MYAFLQNRQLLNPNKSGFRPSDSCINQLLPIMHEIFKSFEATPPLKVGLIFSCIKSFWQSLAWKATLKIKFYWNLRQIL